VSLILDALHRSRQDVNAVPGLATHHPVQQMPVAGRQFLVWVILAVALVVIAWLLMERFSAPPAADIGAPVAELSNNIGSAVTSITTELKARAAVATPTPTTAAAVAEPEPVAAVATSQVATPESTVAATNPPVAPPEAMVATSTVPSPPQDSAAQATAAPMLSAEENDAVAQLYQNRELQKDPVMPESDSRSAQGNARDAPADTSTVAPAEQSSELDQILQQAREELENASLDDHPVPFLSSLSQQTKDDIPTLYYQRHDYSSDPNLSSVVLNGTTVKAGGSPLPGMKVEEIMPDSVVLNYRGTQFRLRALNSWINL